MPAPGSTTATSAGASLVAPRPDFHELRHYCAIDLRYVLGPTREQDGGWLIDKLSAHADDVMLEAFEQAFRNADRPEDDDAVGGDVLGPLRGPR